MSSTVTLKRGDTLRLRNTYERSGTPVDITGYTISSQVRTRHDQKIADLTVAIEADQATYPGRFFITATNTETAAWAPNTYDCDIQIADVDGVTRSTKTFPFVVVQDVTSSR